MIPETRQLVDFASPSSLGQLLGLARLAFSRSYGLTGSVAVFRFSEISE